jgi:hypothetical protein
MRSFLPSLNAILVKVLAARATEAEQSLCFFSSSHTFEADTAILTIQSLPTTAVFNMSCCLCIGMS